MTTSDDINHDRVRAAMGRRTAVATTSHHPRNDETTEECA